MVDAQSGPLGVDVMTAHWEFTLGDKRVKEIVEKDFKGARSISSRTKRANQRFRRSSISAVHVEEMNGVQVAIISQAFLYTPIANPRHFTPEWVSASRKSRCRKVVDGCGRGATAVVLLSHNGMDVDLKLASRVTGIDAIR